MAPSPPPSRPPLALALLAAVLATAVQAQPAPPRAPDAAALAGMIQAHPPPVFALFLACSGYRAQLLALADGRTPCPPAARPAVAALVAARAREVQVLAPITQALQAQTWESRGAAIAAEMSPADRAWLGEVLASGIESVPRAWNRELAAYPDEVARVVGPLIRAQETRVAPHPPPLLPLIFCLAAGAAAATWWRRRPAEAPSAPAADPQTAVTRPASIDAAGGSGPDTAIPPAVRAALCERYQGIVLLGYGGMGLVMRARDRELLRDVAIKIPHTAALVDPDTRRRFVREAQVLAAVTHPSVVRIYDVHTTDPVYYAMELVEGRTLDERLAGARLEPDAALALLEPIAHALAACHAAGLVHRDVKPANILVARDGRSMLTDFGLALPAGGARLTRTDFVVGTVEYLAPELIEGALPTPATDVYAWGMVFYEALARAAAAEERKLSARLREDLPPVSRFAAVGAALAQLVMDCVARDPARRPRDGAALVARLADVARAAAGPGPTLDDLASALESTGAGELHLLKNRVARTGCLDDADRAGVEAVRARLRDLPLPDGVPEPLVARLRALPAALDPADPSSLVRVHDEVAAILEALALPLRALIAEVVTRYGRQARWRVELPPPPIYVLDAGAARRDLETIVANWIDNALEAGAGRVDVLLDSDEPRTRAALVRVQNDGPPIPPDLRERLFREPLTGKGDRRGTGLLTVERIARAAGWHVALEDSGATTFRLTIPRG